MADSPATSINASANICPQCLGAGKITITEIRDFESADKKPTKGFKIECITCDGAGWVGERVLAQHAFYSQCWCSCREAGSTAPPGDALYHEDGNIPWKWCVHKHHWHCAVCRKLVQIG